MNVLKRLAGFFHSLSPATRHTLAAIVILSLDAAGAPAQIKTLASVVADTVAPAVTAPAAQ